jgi:hypothetical protein
MKFHHHSLDSVSLIDKPLDKLIPDLHPKKLILDNLPWDELVSIAKEAYTTDCWKDKPNPRVMIGLLVYACITHERTYRELEEDFSFNALCAYACGFHDMSPRAIHHTTILTFEQNLGEGNLLAIKDIIESMSVKKQHPRKKGNHSLDTTVFHANITYPTDTKLMETVRVFLVEDIIKSYQDFVGQTHRHYTQVARKRYLTFARHSRPTKRIIRKQKKQALQFLRRNLRQADEVFSELKQRKPEYLRTKADKKAFKRLATKLATAHEIYDQQYALYQGEKVSARIVSFHRPGVRPIFRGKTRQPTEFGPKVELSLQGNALILGKTSYDNFYDGHGLKETVTTMKQKGYQVKEVVGDRGNQGCQRFLKKANILDAVARRGKQAERSPPIPQKRFVRDRNRMEGAIGVVKTVFIKTTLKAKTDFGDMVKLCKACMGYNLCYA